MRDLNYWNYENAIGVLVQFDYYLENGDLFHSYTEKLYFRYKEHVKRFVKHNLDANLNEQDGLKRKIISIGKENLRDKLLQLDGEPLTVHWKSKYKIEMMTGLN